MIQSLQHLEDTKFVCITGDAGSGKTRFCLELMTRFLKKHSDLTPLILTEASQWYKIKFNRQYVIFFDDITGKCTCAGKCIGTDDFNRVITIFDQMNSRRSCAFIIFALGNDSWLLKKKCFTASSLIHKVENGNKVDLSGPRFEMTSDEKLSMLIQFCQYKKGRIFYTEKMRLTIKSIDEHVSMVSESLRVIPEDMVRKLCTYPAKALYNSTETSQACMNFDQEHVYISLDDLRSIAGMNLSVGFPFVCERFFCKQFSRHVLDFFQTYSATSHVKEQVDNLLVQKKYLHYAILVFMSSKRTPYTCAIDDAWKQMSSEITEILKTLGIKNIELVTKAEFRECLYDMKHSFLRFSEHMLTLRDLSTFNAILFSFEENFPSQFLELMHIGTLFNYVRSKKYIAGKYDVRSEDTIVRLDDNMIPSLVQKLLNLPNFKQETLYVFVFKSLSFHDKILVNSFLNLVEKDEQFKVIIGPFVVGACQNKKDILASETIKRFPNLYTFELDVFYEVVNHDLIQTCYQFIKHPPFRTLLFEKEKSTKFSRIWDIFKNACQNGSFQCVKALLDVCKEKYCSEDDICNQWIMDFQCREKIVKYIMFHGKSPKHDWSEILICYDEFFPYLWKNQRICEENLMKSLKEKNTDFSIKYLEKIDSISSALATSVLFYWTSIENQDSFFYIMCDKIKKENVHLDPKEIAKLCIVCVLRRKNESMFQTLLSLEDCDFTSILQNGYTILHACEQSNFSNEILLTLLKRPEGMFMFKKKDGCFFKTPVQLRQSYEKVRILGAPGSLRGHSIYEVKWKDDTLFDYRYSFFTSFVKHRIRKSIQRDLTSRFSELYCTWTRVNGIYFCFGIKRLAKAVILDFPGGYLKGQIAFGIEWRDDSLIDYQY